MRGVGTSHLSAQSDGPGSERRRVVFLGVNAADFLPHSDRVRACIDAGHSFAFAFLDADDVVDIEEVSCYQLDSNRGSLPWRVRFRRFLRLQGLRHRGMRRRDPQTLNQLMVAKYDPRFKRLVRRADLVLGLDEASAYWERWVDFYAPGTPFFTGTAVAEVLEEQLWWDRAGTLLSTAIKGGSPTAPSMASLAAHLQSQDHAHLRMPNQFSARMAQDVAMGFARGRGVESAREVLICLDALHQRANQGDADPVLHAALAYVELALGGATSLLVTRTCEGVMATADEALDRGDIDLAARLTRLALALLLHRELHSDGLRSELVENPANYLKPWLGSDVFGTIHGRRRSLLARQSTVDYTKRIVILPGVYPLRDQAWEAAARSIPGTDVELLDMRKRGSVFRGMELDHHVIADLLRVGHSPRWQQSESALASLNEAAVVIADWADPGAVWASLYVRTDAQLILRIHAVDALGGWIHLVNWSRVDDIVFSAPHIRDLVVAMLGSTISHVRIHLFPNFIDIHRYKRKKLPTAQRTLGLVGWAQRVKDPIWALEILSGLIEHDPSWRLLLIGSTFGSKPPRSGALYQDEFLRRVKADGLSHHVEFRGFTSSLEVSLDEVGFVVSASRREGCPVGFAEGVASGAVPILRDWPIFASKGGAARTFRPEWVVKTPEEAVRRISERATASAWWNASEEAQSQLSEMMPGAHTLDRMRRVMNLSSEASDSLGS